MYDKNAASAATPMPTRTNVGNDDGVNILDDPIEALRGVYATPGPAADVARAADRAAEAASDDRWQGTAG